jgi:hypothetical protein
MKPVTVRIDGDKEIVFQSADEMAAWLVDTMEDYDERDNGIHDEGKGGSKRRFSLVSLMRGNELQTADGERNMDVPMRPHHTREK